MWRFWQTVGQVVTDSCLPLLRPVFYFLSQVGRGYNVLYMYTELAVFAWRFLPVCPILNKKQISSLNDFMMSVATRQAWTCCLGFFALFVSSHFGDHDNQQRKLGNVPLCQVSDGPRAFGCYAFASVNPGLICNCELLCCEAMVGETKSDSSGFFFFLYRLTQTLVHFR